MTISSKGALKTPSIRWPIRAVRKGAFHPSENMTTYRTLLTTYCGLAGNYPSTAQGLKALTGDPTPLNWHKLQGAVDEDPWGRDFIYRCPGEKNTETFDSYSMGKDGQPGTSDDVWSN
jgi:type II secretion system protein G